MTSSATLPHHVIRASAGSGKTYLLAVHYLRLLRDGADPGSILATTFTRKAAGEILHRVLGRLAAAVLDESCGEMRRLSEDLNKGLPARKHRPLDRQDCLRLLDKLCGQLHGLSIGTIDAFLSRVVSCYRHELGLAAGMTMISPGDPLDRQLRRRAIEAVLEGEQDVRTMLELLRRLHHDQASRSVTQALEDITSDLYDLYREAPEADVWQRLQPPPGLLPPVELQSHILNLGELVPRKWDSQMAKALAGDYHAAAAWDWEIFLQKGLAAKIAQDGADAKFYRKPIPPDLVDAYEPLIEHARADLIGRVAQRTSAMHDLLTRFDGHYLRLRREQGLLLFSDLTWLLGQAINPPPEDDNPSGMADAATMFSLDDLYYRLDSSVQHLLLDEFQDTSPSQWRVLRPLAQEIAAHGDGSRRLLCVGDVKQSIYGWRGGCAEIFSRVADDLNLPPESLGRLSLCWRSSPVVLRAVNKLFSDLPANAALTDHRDVTEAWIEGFEPHQAADPKRPGYVELCLAPAIESADHDAPDDDSVETIDHGYLGWVALRIAELARTAPTASIGVLLRRNAVAGALIHLLRQKGVEVSGEGGSTLLDDAGVNLILAGLRLADHPGDSAAAFHVRISPLGPVVGLEDDSKLHAEATARRIRRELLEEGYGRVLDRWARTLIPYADARGRARLSQLCTLADRHGPRATLRPGDFVEMVQTVRVEEPSPARVRVMTIHAAKGLEFDAVVLPELAGKMFPRPPIVTVQRPIPTEPPTAVYAGARQAIRDLCPELTDAHRQHEDRQLRDELCTLYVAMTRARYALHMFAPPQKRNKNHDLAKRQLSQAGIVIEGLRQHDEPAGDEIQSEAGHVLYQDGDSDWATSLRHKTPSTPEASAATERTLGMTLALPVVQSREETGLLDRRAWPRVSPSALEKRSVIPAANLLAVAPRDDSPAPGNLTRQHGLQRGRLWHLWLSMVEWLNGDAPLPTDTQWLNAAARELGPQPAGEDWSALATELRQKLRMPGLRQVLTRPIDLQHTDLWRERRFAVRLRDTLVTGIFDRVVVHRRDGVPVSAELWDYKTDHLPDGPASIAKLIDVYRPQMLAYRDALAAMLKLSSSSITAQLLFLNEQGKQAEQTIKN